MAVEKWFGKKRALSDEEIIEGIKAGGLKKEKCITYLHRTYMSYLYEKLPKRYSVSIDDLKDAYADSLLKVVDQIISEKFRGESKLSTYFYRIFYNACIDKYRSATSYSQKATWVEEFPQIADNSMNIMKTLTVQEDFEHLKGLLATLGERCKNIIWYSSYWGYSHREIAEKMGFKNAQSVTSQRYSCLAKLHKILEQQKEAFSTN